jgi:hypothetical protein
MQASYTTSEPVIFNSAVNAAVFLLRIGVFGGAYNPFLQACYVASGMDTNMDVFESAQLNGDTSEGWTTAFLLDLIDTVNEVNNGINNNFGRALHGDMVYKLQQLKWFCVY